MHPILDVLTLARLCEVAFNAEGRLEWYPYESANIVVMIVPEFAGISRKGTVLGSEVLEPSKTACSRKQHETRFC